MNLQIINGYAGTDHGLPTAGTDPNRRYKQEKERYTILQTFQYCEQP